MSTGFLIFGLCVIVVLAGALPLLRDRGAPKNPPPPRETLRDWRNHPDD